MSSFEQNKQKDYQVARANQELFRQAIQHVMDGNLADLESVLGKCLSESGSQYSMHDVVVGFHSEGKTLLHMAASSGKLDILQCLLGKVNSVAAVIDNGDDKGMTMLINATISESFECIAYLLEHRANVNARNKDGASALHFAAADGNVKRMELLCSHGADLTYTSQSGTALHWAAGKGHVAAMMFLVQRSNSQNNLMNITNSSGVPAVLMAAVSGCDEGVKLLVEAGADIGAIIAGNLTLLHICAEHNLALSVAAILNTETGRKCCDVATSDGQNTPLLLAAMAGHEHILRLLLPYTQSTEKSVEEIMNEGKRRMLTYNARRGQEQEEQNERKERRKSLVSEDTLKEYDNKANIDSESKSEAEKRKEEGNQYFKSKEYDRAIEAYSRAITLDKYNAAYYSNRSACFMAINQPEQAIIDAEICRRLEPKWVKGCFRLATARLALKKFEDAALAAFEGCKLDPSNKELKALMQEAVRQGQEDFKLKNKS